MNISAVNCTPIKPQASFGREVDFSDVDRLNDISRKYDEYADASGEKPKQKSLSNTLISVGVAIAATFIGGKLLAARTLDILPKDTPVKIAGFAKSLFGKVSTGLTNISKNEQHVRIANVAKHANNVLKNVKSGISNIVKKQGIEEVITNTVGIGSILGVAPKILTADGNNDSIPDITQEGINAYKNALDDFTVVSDIMKALI